MNRVTIINDLIKKHQYASYLEIGVRHKSVCFNQIQCEKKVSIDPGKEDEYDFNMTSDEFFNINTSTFDIIFIDGLHTAEQSYKDIMNSLNILNTNGTIVVHDTNPPTEFHALENLYGKNKNIVAGSNWNGTVWKSIFKLRKTRDDLTIQTYDCDWGVTIIKKEDSSLLELENEFFSFHIFDKNRSKILNIVKT
jgi:hypothetical protein